MPEARPPACTVGKRIGGELMSSAAQEACIRRSRKRADAIFLGNPMMDGLIPKSLDLGNDPIVGILPGSREEAYENLRRTCRPEWRPRPRSPPDSHGVFR